MPESSQRSHAKRLWYNWLHILCRLTALIVWRVRVHGQHWEPATGGVLVLSNHQSHLDPVLTGLAMSRRLNYLARQTLFRFGPFRWLINSLDAIPLDREGLGLSGLRETLRRLKRGEMVLIFPEGTRTPDGQLQTLKPGFCALAQRAGVPLLPMAIAGAYDSWPKRRLLPRPGMVEIYLGEPIPPEEIGNYAERELVDEVERRIAACLARAEAGRRRRGVV